MRDLILTDNVCEEKHKAIESRLDLGEKRMDEHSRKIDNLEQYKAKSEERIDNLCRQIESLVSVMKWGIGIFLGTIFTSLVGFFMWYVQTK